MAAALEVTLEATLAAEAAAEDVMAAEDVIVDATFCWAFDTTEEAAVAVAADTALWLVVDRRAGEEIAAEEATDFCITSATSAAEERDP